MAEAGPASEKGAVRDGEVLLPEVVGRLLAGEGPGGSTAAPFRVLRAGGRC